MKLEKEALKTIRKYDLLSRGDKILVSVSGGPDSIVLLYFLHRLSMPSPSTLHPSPAKLHVFHLNHGLRKSAQKEAEFVAEITDELNLPLISLKYDVGAFAEENKLSIQDAARKVRYRLLEEQAKIIDADKIAIGHNADDQVETFLLRVLRGAALRGLKGIPPKRGKIIRPLIGISRDEINDYIKRNKLKYIIDPTNLKSVYSRNKLRLEVMPILKEINPNYQKTILKNIELVSDDENYLQTIAKTEFNKIAVIDLNLLRLHISKLQKLPVAIQRRLVVKAIEKIKGNLLQIESVHIEDIRNKLGDQSFKMSLPGEIVVFKENSNLIFAHKKVLDKPKIKPVQLNVPGETIIKSLGIKIIATLEKNTGELKINKQTIDCMDSSKIYLPLTARTRKPGDRFTPFGMQNPKKLQDFLVDKKVPYRDRDKIPIIEDQKGIVWVGSLQIDERARVNENTKEVLFLQLFSLQPSVLF